MRVIKPESLYKLMDDIEKDMPDVPWRTQFNNYLRALRKMIKNLVIEVEDNDRK